MKSKGLKGRPKGPRPPGRPPGQNPPQGSGGTDNSAYLDMVKYIDERIKWRSRGGKPGEGADNKRLLRLDTEYRAQLKKRIEGLRKELKNTEEGKDISFGDVGKRELDI